MANNAAWEITEDDVETVLRAHPESLANGELREGLLDEAYKLVMAEENRIVEGVLHFTDMDEQTDSMNEDIEEILIKAGILTEPRQFVMPGNAPAAAA